MKQVRRSEERGTTNISWLKSFHSFSFGDYHDPEHMGFRSLRVINDDYIAPGGGFGTHPHKNMEIITYVLSGALEHRDSMGNGEVLRAGELQRMTAGKGILHSEFNHSKSEPVHLLQIWIEPSERGLAPSYEQRAVAEALDGKFYPVVTADGSNGTLRAHQDVVLSLARIKERESTSLQLNPERYYWLHVATGNVESDGLGLQAGDAIAMHGESELTVMAQSESQLLLFDLA